jgi:hypothetical protein
VLINSFQETFLFGAALSVVGVLASLSLADRRVAEASAAPDFEFAAAARSGSLAHEVVTPMWSALEADLGSE